MTRTSLLPIAAAPALAAVLLAAPLAADGPRLLPIKDPVVAKECSACHMLYPAGLLPARSWAAITANLTDHFGDNAELDAPATQRVAGYLPANAADSAKGSSKVLRGLWTRRRANANHRAAVVDTKAREEGSRHASDARPQGRQVQGRLHGLSRGCGARHFR